MFLDPNDVAVGKLARGQDNDLRWVRAGLREGMLQTQTLAMRIAQTPRLSTLEAQAAQQRLDAIKSDLAQR